jgi:hypothetical protein
MGKTKVTTMEIIAWNFELFERLCKLEKKHGVYFEWDTRTSIVIGSVPETGFAALERLPDFIHELFNDGPLDTVGCGYVLCDNFEEAAALFKKAEWHHPPEGRVGVEAILFGPEGLMTENC